MDGPSKSTIYGGQTWVDAAVEQSIWLLFFDSVVVSRNVTKGETGLAVEEIGGNCWITGRLFLDYFVNSDNLCRTTSLTFSGSQSGGGAAICGETPQHNRPPIRQSSCANRVPRRKACIGKATGFVGIKFPFSSRTVKPGWDAAARRKLAADEAPFFYPSRKAASSSSSLAHSPGPL